MLETSNRASIGSFAWVIALLIGGLIATAAWEFYARGVSPNFFAPGAAAEAADDLTDATPLGEGEENNVAQLGEGDENNVAPLGEGEENDAAQLGEGDENDVAPTGDEAFLDDEAAPAEPAAAAVEATTAPEITGFAGMIAGVLGKETIPGLALSVPDLVSALAAKMEFNLPADEYASFDLAGEMFVIDMPMIVNLALGVILLPLLYMLIVRPIFFFLPWIILGPLFGALVFALFGYVVNGILLEQTPFFGLLGMDTAAAATDNAAAVPAAVADFAEDEGFDKGLSWLIGDVVYGLFLGLFARIIAGR